MEMHPSVARTFWKALMDNAANLIADAHVLLESGSYGRARSLTVLAQEELGKALWVYDTFQDAWSTGAEEALATGQLIADGRVHVKKYMAAFVFGQELAEFWGDYSSGPAYPETDSQDAWDAYFADRTREAETAARRANDEKMAGFYVDVDPAGHVTSPATITVGTIADDLRIAAQVIEMLLIKDHSRMKFDAATPYDSTHPQQFRLLPISHPEEWAAAEWLASTAREPSTDETGPEEHASEPSNEE